MSEYLIDLQPSPPRRVIAVETSRRACDDAFLEQLAQSAPLIAGYVANLQPDLPDFPARLAAHCENPMFKGLRLRPIERFDLGSADVAAICAAMQEAGKILELGTKTPARLSALMALAAEFPALKMILVHAGHPDLSQAGGGSAWQHAISSAPAANTLWCKITPGFGRAIGPLRAEEKVVFQQCLRTLEQTFGEDHLLFGSNWPVAGHAYVDQALEAMSSVFSSATLAKILRCNGQNIYGIG